MELLGSMGASGVSAETELAWIGLVYYGLFAPLVMPSYISVSVRDAQVVDEFLEHLDPVMRDLAANLQTREYGVDYYTTRPASGSCEFRCVGGWYGPLRVRYLVAGSVTGYTSPPAATFWNNSWRRNRRLPPGNRATPPSGSRPGPPAWRKCPGVCQGQPDQLGGVEPPGLRAEPRLAGRGAACGGWKGPHRGRGLPQRPTGCTRPTCSVPTVADTSWPPTASRSPVPATAPQPLRGQSRAARRRPGRQPGIEGLSPVAVPGRRAAGGLSPSASEANANA